MADNAKTYKCTKCDANLQITGSGKIGFCPVHEEYFPLTDDAEARAEAARENKRGRVPTHKCMKCGRVLQIAGSGIVGFCHFHEEYFPLVDDPDARTEAARENKRYQIEKKRKKRAAAAKRAGLLLFAAVLAAVAVVWFVVIPSDRYNDATALFEQGDYATARDRFSALGDYKNSADQTVLCDALLALQNGDLSAAMLLLNELTANSADDAAAMLRASFVPMVADWQAHNLSPQALLSLLAQADTFDPDGTLDRDALFLEAHVAMLEEGDILAWYVSDLNGDQQEDLVVLKGDFSVAAYRILENGNAKVTLDRFMSGECLLTFGQRFSDEDTELALNCYLAAYQLRQDAETKQLLAQAYQTRATAYEAKNRYEDALADAKFAYEAMGTQEALAFYYDMCLRRCYSEADKARGIALWDDFRAGNASRLQSYGMEEGWRLNSGDLRLAYAMELASWQDASCPAQLRLAWEYGASIEEALLSAIERFDSVKTKTDLRLLALDLYADAPESLARQTALLAEEVGDAIAHWTERSIEAGDVFALMMQAESLNLDLSGVDTAAACRSAALAVAAPDRLSAYLFVDFDADGREELLGVGADGAVAYYALDESFRCVMRAQSGIAAPVLYEINAEAPAVLLEAGAKDAFAVYAYRDGRLQAAFSASGLLHYNRDDEAVSYDLALEGSIERYAQYRYTLHTLPAQAETTGVDWQADDYPMPKTAGDAVLRYLEATGYGFAEEAARLLGEAAYDGLHFDQSALAGLAAPDMPLSLTCVPYYVDDEAALCEVSYLSGGSEVQTYVFCAAHEDGWRLAGAGNSYQGLSADGAQSGGSEMALLTLNKARSATLEGQEDSHEYRILLPFPARVQLAWGASDEKSSSAAFVAGLYQGLQTADPYIAYSLRLSEDVQQAQPAFLPAGVYRLNVSAASNRAREYTFVLNASPAWQCEAESNDTIPAATPVTLGQAWQGTLQKDGDIDIYSFTLEKPMAVTVTMAAEASGSASTRYALSLADGESYMPLEYGEMTGNEEKHTTNAVYLSAGKYLLQVQQGRDWYAGEYSLTVNASEAPYAEAERNDAPASATPIELNRVISATSGVSGDVDCFTFALNEPGLARVQLSFPATKSAKETYRLSLLNGDAVVWTGSAAGKDGTLLTPSLALPGGTYILKVENPVWNHSAYQVRVVFEAAVLETENNNALSSATPLEVNSVIHGALLNVSDAQTGTDIDNYRFTLAQPGRVKVQFSHDGPEARGVYFTLALADTNVNALYAANITGANPETLSDHIYLDAGAYILQVVSGREIWQGAYSLCVQYEANDACEREYNDTPAAACELAPNAQVVGSFAANGDIDYFRFTLPSDGIVRPNLSFTPLESASRAYVLTLSDGTNDLQVTRIGGKESNKVITPTILAAGTYYMRLENPAYTPQDYALSLSYQPVAGAEREPNDTLANATPLLPGAPLCGLLSTEEDEDVYMIALEADATVALRLSFDPVSASDVYFVVQLEQNGRSLWSARAVARDGGLEQLLQIPAGTYYLRVKPSTWAAVIYTLEIQ